MDLRRWCPRPVRLWLDRATMIKAALAAALLVACGLVPALPVVSARAASAIVVSGTRRVEADTIRSYFRAGSNGQLDAAAIDQGLKALLATGLFRDVKIGRAGDQLTVTVVEAPVINKVQLEGNKALKDEQLKNELQSKPLGGFNQAKIQADAARLVELYHRVGRFDARVDPKTIERPGDRVDLVFEIHEGDKTTVKKIAFVGNASFSERRLKDVIKTAETGLLSFIQTNNVYDPDLIESDRDLLRRFYLKSGFADVRIVSAAGQYDEAEKGFVVTFTVEEGDRYHFGRVDIDSHVPVIDKGTLTGLLLMRAGDVYNAETVDKTIEQLTIAIAKRGYPFAAVTPHAERNRQSKTIDVALSLDEGPRTYVERINIRGNTRTHDYVIRREFDIAEGDAYNRALIDRAERRLKNLGYFKTVKITTEPGSAPDRVIVNVDAEDQQTGDLSFSGGYSTTDGIVGEVSVGDRNLFGRGEVAKVSVTLGQFAKAFELSLAEPYIFGTNATAGVDLFFKQNAASNFQSFGSQTYGANFNLSTPLTEELTQQWRYSLYDQSVSLGTAVMPSIAVRAAALNSPSVVSMVGSSTIYNTLDNFKNPTSGVRAQFNQDVAGLGGTANFLKTTTDIRGYHEIGDGVVAMARAQSGVVAPWGGKQVPFQSAFFGGPQFVRGFAPNGFGPRDLTAGTTMDNIGGSKYWATTAELQSAVPYLPSSAGLKVAVFADAGSLWGYRGPTTLGGQTLTLGDSKAIRSAFGAGLIWDSPVGPLRLDYAFPVTKQPYDVTQRLKFGAGAF